MKKNFLFIVLILGVIGCSKEDCDVSRVETANLCGGQNLNITKLSRFSTVYLLPNGDVSPTQSPRWYWRTYNDTIEVSGGTLIFGQMPRTTYFFFKKNGLCVDYLSAREFTNDDSAWVVDINGNVLQHGYHFYDYTDLIFKQQEYRKNEVLVGEVSGRKIWIEFSPDTNDINVPNYLQFYP